MEIDNYQDIRVSYLDWKPLAIGYSDRHPVGKRRKRNNAVIKVKCK
jgi:hypothetical protein